MTIGHTRSKSTPQRARAWCTVQLTTWTPSRFVTRAFIPSYGTLQNCSGWLYHCWSLSLPADTEPLAEWRDVTARRYIPPSPKACVSLSLYPSHVQW